jgi:hypothetical protein
LAAEQRQRQQRVAAQVTLKAQEKRKRNLIKYRILDLIKAKDVVAVAEPENSKGVASCA